jgi:hypothetical protein
LLPILSALESYGLIEVAKDGIDTILKIASMLHVHTRKGAGISSCDPESKQRNCGESKHHVFVYVHGYFSG